MAGIFQSRPLWPQFGLAIARIITGALMTYHGFEIFNAGIMKTYLGWEVFTVFPSVEIAVYAGKALELVAGLLLILGLWTRFASLLLIILMSYICFFVSKGRFWYEDQHPFLFVVLGWIFLTAGPGAWAIDRKK